MNKEKLKKLTFEQRCSLIENFREERNTPDADVNAANLEMARIRRRKASQKSKAVSAILKMRGIAS